MVCHIVVYLGTKVVKSNLRICWHYTTLVLRATLRGVAELHVASGMPQWRMFVTCCYF